VQTCITVQFTPVAGVNYQLQWKEAPATWENDSKSMAVNSNGDAALLKVETDQPLQPGTTYCLRLADASDNGKFGPELVVDTEQVGCTPKADKSCCVIV